jgi:hypothetical protein
VSHGEQVAKAIAHAASRISPEEDVKGYMQQAVLPVLGPAIEDLLHFVHESGELTRMLREKAEQESAANRPARRQPVAAPADAKGANPGSSKTGHDRRSPAANKPSAPQPVAAAAPSGAVASDDADGKTEGEDGLGDEEEPAGFDPLIWLSEHLMLKAAGPTAQFREKIEQRIKQKLAEEDASIIEEGEEDAEGGSGGGGAAAGATGGGGGPTAADANAPGAGRKDTK